MRDLHNSVLSPVVCSCLVFGHRFGHRCPPSIPEVPGRGIGRVMRARAYTAGRCGWDSPRSKNENSGVREMSSPPRLSGQTPARNRAPRLEQWPTPNKLSKMPAQAGGLLSLGCPPTHAPFEPALPPVLKSTIHATHRTLTTIGPGCPSTPSWVAASRAGVPAVLGQVRRRD